MPTKSYIDPNGGIPTSTSKPISSELSSLTVTNPMSALGDLVVGGASGTPTRLPGDTSNTRKLLLQQATAGVAGQSGWDVIQHGDLPVKYVAGAGSKNALTATLAPAITAYPTGLLVALTTTVATNDAAATLALNSLAAKAIVTKANAALSGGELVLNTTYLLVYDGTSFRLV